MLGKPLPAFLSQHIPGNTLIKTTPAATAVILNLFPLLSSPHIVHCHLFYDVFRHTLGLQSCYPIVRRMYVNCARQK